MPTTVEMTYQPHPSLAPARYFAYVPDPLGDLADPVSASGVARITAAVADVREVAGAIEREHPVGLGELMVRIEAAASSAIEGEVAAAPAVLRTELGAQTQTRACAAIVRAVAVVRQATTGALASAPRVELTDALDLQSHLVPALAGVRTGAVWIGGYSPVSAAFVPPPAAMVPDLLEDLFAWVNTADVDPITRAAVFHAQLETIHPFADGNGRTGRALTCALLTRDLLGAGAMPPMSVAIAARRRDYYDALMFWREGTAHSRARWVSWFADALAAAAGQARVICAQGAAMREGARAGLVSMRARALRPDSTLAALVEDLLERPAHTTASAAARYGVSAEAARGALETLVSAGAMTCEPLGRAGASVYLSLPALALLGRQWVQPHLDTW